MTTYDDMTPDEQRVHDRHAIRYAFIAHIRLLLEKIGGTLSIDREKKMYGMRMNELVDLGVNLRGISTFRDAVLMLVTAIDKSDRVQLHSN